MQKEQHCNSRLTCIRKLYRCLQKINIYFNLVKRGRNKFDIQHLKENVLKLIEKSNVDNNQLDHTDQLITSIKDNSRNVIGRQLEH